MIDQYPQDYVKDNCPKSCGLCKGMTPAASNTCYDMFNNCPDLAETNCHKFGSQCKKSCGLCDGMTPHKSNIKSRQRKLDVLIFLGNTCFDAYTNCKDVCQWYTGDQCNLACGKC